MYRLTVPLSLVAIGCAAGCGVDQARVTDSHLVGSYHFSYFAPEDQPVTYTCDDTNAKGPDGRTLGSAFAVFYRVPGELEIVVGNWISDPAKPDRETGRCPPRAEARLRLRGILPSDSPRTIPVERLETFQQLYYSDRAVVQENPDLGVCPPKVREVPEEEVVAPAALLGRVRLESLRADCPAPQFGPTCALIARGSWALTGVDAQGAVILETHGKFAETDEVLVEGQGFD